MDSFTDHDLIVFSFFKNGPNSWKTNDELCELLQISESSLKKRTRALSEAGVLERLTGDRKHWFRLYPKSLEHNPIARRLEKALEAKNQSL